LKTLIKILAITAALASTLAAPARADAKNGEDSARTKTYRIRTTDKISIRVFQEDDLTTICRVDAKGTVNLPLVGRAHDRGGVQERALP
jgi:polysaccharide export outer membrane protein